MADIEPDSRETQALLMRHYGDLSYEEMGCILGIEAAAARKRAGRALLRLHRILSDMERKEP